MEEIRDQAKWLDSNGPLAKLLSSMLTYVGGEHGPSFKAGYDAAQKHSKIPSAPKPKPAEVNATPATPMGAPKPSRRMRRLSSVMIATHRLSSGRRFSLLVHAQQSLV